MTFTVYEMEIIIASIGIYQLLLLIRCFSFDLVISSVSVSKEATSVCMVDGVHNSPVPRGK